MENLLPFQATSSILFTVAALVAGTYLIYFYLPSWRLRRIPGPPALPLIGHLPLFGKHGLEVFKLLANRYGPIYRFQIGRQPLVLVASPELCKEVGIKKFKSAHNKSLPISIRSAPIHSKGLMFTSEFPRWQSLRNLIVNIYYQPSHVANLIRAVQPYVERAGRLLHPGEEVTFSELAVKLFSDTLGQVAFGVDFGLTNDRTQQRPVQGPGVIDSVTDFIEKHIHVTTSLKMDLSAPLSIVTGLVAPFLQEPVRQLMLRVPGSADRRLEDTNAALSGLLDTIVAEQAAKMDRGQNNFLSVVLKASETMEDVKKLLTPDTVNALTYEHLIAGSATSAFSLSSLVYLVAMHPEVEEKLLREIDDFGPKDVVPTSEELMTKFPYVEQVLKESLRFFPAVPLVAREAAEDMEIGGYLVPKGTWVWLGTGVLARDPKQFPDPDVFRPERFDPESEECKKRHPYAFIPFGIGPRLCPAQKFAMQQLMLVVIHLYRQYVFRHSPSMEFPLQFQFSLLAYFKHGVKVQVIQRKN
ncbi:hypothetical protein EJB05_55744, partial [Eragrostis curvula]